MNIRTTFLGGLLLLLLCGGLERARAQDEPVAVDLDHTVFAYSDSTSLVELYFAFKAASLPFESAASGYRASVPVTVRMAPAGEGSTPVWRDSLSLQFTVGDTADIRAGHMFLHQLRTSVPPGKYLLRIDQPDTVSPDRSMRTIERKLVVEDFTELGQARSSEMTLASRSRRSNSREPFLRAGAGGPAEYSREIRRIAGPLLYVTPPQEHPVDSRGKVKNPEWRRLM